VLSGLMQPAAAVYQEDPYREDPAEEVSDVQLRQRADESGDVEPDAGHGRLGGHDDGKRSPAPSAH
jgi:hypothetical protein